MTEQLPFRVEYAKSGRASCKACKVTIAKDELRLAKLVQSPFHDGMMATWFHPHCFFTKAKPKSITEIANFDNVKWDDQEFIRKKIEEEGGSTDRATTSGKGRKRPKTEAFKDFKVEYAKSNRSQCVGCEAPIIKDNVRVSKKDYESEKAVKFGGLDRWYHLECFAQLRNDLEFFGAGNKLPGFKTLKSEDQSLVNKQLPAIKGEDLPPASKKVKKESVDPAEEKLMIKQNDKLFKMRDQLKALTKHEVTEILVYNHQFIPEGIDRLLDSLADQMTFGALPKCDKCNGPLRFKSGFGYKCMGNISEWTKCDNVVKDPERSKLKIPQDLKEKHDFLQSFKSKVEKRIMRIACTPASTSVVKKEEGESGPKITKTDLPLRGMQFVIAGRTSKNKDTLKKEIMQLGGTVVNKVHENLAAVISSEKSLEKGGKHFDDAEQMDIQVVTEDFIEEAKDFKDAPVSLITKKNIAGWGGDPSSRISAHLTKSASMKNKSMYEKSGGNKVKLRVKNGGVVDPDSGLEDVAHIYQKDNMKYTVTLGITAIETNKNSFYKLQVLEHDNQKKYWLFRSWGRIGTTIGGNKLESHSLNTCIKEFERLYLEKTGNHWRNKDSFVKQPNMMYPIDTDENDDSDKVGNLESEIKSNLKKPIQDLIRLIFDINIMKKVMKEFELDTEKMPLGKLSKKQLEEAYAVLKEAQQLIVKENPERILLIDVSNRFYTLVPHSFGVREPPLLDNEEIIKKKCEMLESLIEMEIAYSLLNAKTDDTKNPLDAHYQQLNIDVDVLDRDSEEFKLIDKYAKNTHAATHSSYNLEIENVFKVKRKGEDKRFKPFEKFPNRKLLWHGSRTTNFAGILSQGLKIAPPEAPVTGYMFGKGIYFADMVSKSANYCCTDAQNSTGLLLLCEVALGNMYERVRADYIEKLPKGKHSTFGKGQTCPDPKQTCKLPNGVEVPCGTPVPADAKNSSLLYNEYIVYDVSQVKVQYLVRMKFKYKF
ncbi:poly [ADP-ribose] polymerase [Chelonus insularis]|uniref:poly [ADP-ribose] polymerase n=1 Tax=Chelonus insularis TaxID=460826 RepID=UPI00158B6784|nr:poly [ADP-ribose] polymerase [Chelonus insularis]